MIFGRTRSNNNKSVILFMNLIHNHLNLNHNIFILNQTVKHILIQTKNQAKKIKIKI